MALEARSLAGGSDPPVPLEPRPIEIGDQLARGLAERADQTGLALEGVVHLEEAVVDGLAVGVDDHLHQAVAVRDGLEEHAVALLRELALRERGRRVLGHRFGERAGERGGQSAEIVHARLDLHGVEAEADAQALAPVRRAGRAPLHEGSSSRPAAAPERLRDLGEQLREMVDELAPRQAVLEGARHAGHEALEDRRAPFIEQVREATHRQRNVTSPGPPGRRV